MIMQVQQPQARHQYENVSTTPPTTRLKQPLFTHPWSTCYHSYLFWCSNRAFFNFYFKCFRLIPANTCCLHRSLTHTKNFPAVCLLQYCPLTSFCPIPSSHPAPAYSQIAHSLPSATPPSSALSRSLTVTTDLFVIFYTGDPAFEYATF